MLGSLHNLDRLIVFMAVVETRSLSRAAERLLLTQPSVSGHIKALEDGLGVRLLDRGQKGTVPTEAGRFVYEQAKQLVKTLEALESGVAEFRSAEVGAIALGAVMSIGNYLLPPILSSFKFQHPGAEILLRIAYAELVYEMVRRGEVQFGLTTGIHTADDLAAEVICRDQLVLVTAPSHPLARYATVTTEQLACQDFVIPARSGTTGQLVLDSLAEVGVSPRIIMRLEAPEAVKRVVETGVGVAILYRTSVAPELKAGTLLEIGIQGMDLWGNYNIVYNPSAHQSPILRLFLAFLRTEAAALLATIS